MTTQSSTIKSNKNGSVTILLSARFFDSDSADYVLLDPRSGKPITEFDYGLEEIGGLLRERKKVGKKWMWER